MSGPTNSDEFDGVAAGADGSVFVTGRFVGNAALAGADLVGVDRADVPVARFAADGDLLWATSFGGSGEDNFFDIDADAAGAVATGYFEGVVDFGGFTVEAVGATDCVVASFDNDGTVEWVSTFGGPGPDGCNEVTLGSDGSITTSIDTVGGWDAEGVEIEASDDRDTVLLRLDRNGRLQWSRSVGGDNTQRGKSIAVNDAGLVVFGGDTAADLVIGDTVFERPGAGRDAWVTAWTPAGELLWTRVWGGAGKDLSKGLAVSDDRIYAVVPFEGRIRVGDDVLTSRGGNDLAVIGLDMSGEVDWVTTIGAETPISGGEVVLSSHGGVIVPGAPLPTATYSSADGSVLVLDTADRANAWLAEYDRDGMVVAVSPIPGTAGANPSEIDRIGDRVIVDIVVRGDANTIPDGTPISTNGKDASVWMLNWDRRLAEVEFAPGSPSSQRSQRVLSQLWVVHVV